MSRKNKVVNNFLIIIVLFVLVILIGFLTAKKPAFEYKMTAKESLQEVINDSNLLRPEKAMAIIANKHPQYNFIDLRNPHDYEMGHLENAMNIPFKDLLSKDYEKILNQDEKINVLYCASELKAKEAYLLLRQLGYKNMNVLLGGYDFVTEYIMDGYKTKMGNYPDDKALYDYAQVAKETKGTRNNQKKEPVVPKVVVKKKRVESGVAGGC